MNIKKTIKITVSAGVLAFLMAYSMVQGATILFPYQGGTGKGTATAGDVGKVLTVSDDSPFTYSFTTPSSFALTNGSGTTVGGDSTSINLGGELTSDANIGVASDNYIFSISQATGGTNYFLIDAKTTGKLNAVLGDYETNFTVDKVVNRLILNTSGGINFVDLSLPAASNGYVWTLSDKTTGMGGWAIPSVAWGNITGTLSNQTDLQTALNAKQDDITGADTRVLFFDGANNPAGDGGLTYNKTTDTLTIAGGLVVDTNTLFVDSTNNRVGINNASPSFALHAVDTTTSASSFKFEFTGWTGAAYTNGIVINSTDASAYYPNHIKLTNAAYGTNGTIFTANNNGIYYSSDTGSVRHIFRDITYNIGTFSTIASEPTLTIANTPAADKIGIAITGHASQTASLQEWQNSSGTPLLKVEADGDLNFGTSGTGGIFGYGGSTIKFSPDAGQNAIRFTPAGGSNYWKTFNSGANLYFQFVPSAGATVFDSYGASLYLGVTSGTGVVIDTSNLVAIGHASPSAQLHVINTAEQLRVGYNTSNYWKTTVASNGSTTFDLAGTSPEFTFSDPVNFTDIQVDSITNDTGLAAGTYTPTRSAESNLDSNVTMFEAQYMRVGNTVTVSGRFTADPTTPATATSFEMTLPVASNFGAVEDCAGTAFSGAVAGQGAQISGSVANNTMVVTWTSGDVTSQSWSFHATYQVI